MYVFTALQTSNHLPCSAWRWFHTSFPASNKNSGLTSVNTHTDDITVLLVKPNRMIVMQFHSQRTYYVTSDFLISFISFLAQKLGIRGRWAAQLCHIFQDEQTPVDIYACHDNTLIQQMTKSSPEHPKYGIQKFASFYPPAPQSGWFWSPASSQFMGKRRVNAVFSLDYVITTGIPLSFWCLYVCAWVSLLPERWARMHTSENEINY